MKKHLIRFLRIVCSYPRRVWCIKKLYFCKVPSSQSEAPMTSNGTTNGIAVSTASGGHGWKQESLHVPAPATEVNPTLYEELKLGQDGAGFKRLKP